MGIKLTSFIHKQKKYSSLVILLLIIIFLTAIISPALLDQKRRNWNKDLPERITKIENGSLKHYKQKEKRLLLKSKEFKKELSKKLISENQSYGDLIQLINDNKYRNNSIEIIAPNGKLIAWSYNQAVKEDKLFPLPYPAGDVFFYQSELTTYLTLIDSVHAGGDIFYFIFSRPIEKNYNLQNDYYKEISLSKELQDLFLTDFEIEFNSIASGSKDGMHYSYDLLNNNSHKIGVITFLKPMPDMVLRDFKDKLSKIQSILITLACIFLFLGFRKDYKKLKYRSLKIAALFFYCAVFRILIYVIGFPSNILSDSLTNSSFYSSTFAFGIVKSPAEFIITNFFVLVIALQIHRQIFSFTKSKNMYSIKNKNALIAIYLIFNLAILLIIRAWSSAVKSIIFDSTLRYFNDTTLIQNLPFFVMNLNSFALGLSMAIILITLLFFFFRLSDPAPSFVDILRYLLITIILSVIFILIQKEPLLNIPFILLIVIVLNSIFLILFFNRIKPIYNLVFIAMAGSFITVLMMNYFNIDLEKRTLKTTALEINRPDNNYYKFLLTETLNNSAQSELIQQLYYKPGISASSIAFKLWSISPFQKENLNSSFSILDTAFNEIGYFKTGEPQRVQHIPGIINAVKTNMLITEENKFNRKSINGIIPVLRNNRIRGYINVTLEIDINNLNSSSIPPFLSSRKLKQNSAVDLSQLNIFIFNNRQIVDVLGDIYPSRDQVKPIFNASFSSDNEAWLTLKLNNEEYIVYLLKTHSGETEKITAILYKSKHISLNLFNFFKIFIVHALFILVLVIIIFFTRIKTFQYSFRSQLLFSFLIISLLPLILLAIYNRQTVTKRINESVQKELNERADYVQKFITKNNSDNNDLDSLFMKTSNELGISFTIYEGSNEVFSSSSELINAGLIPGKLNPLIYYNLYYLSYREFTKEESIDNYFYTSFYKKFNIGEKPLIVQVSSALNEIKINFTASDVDVFLFGMYTLAIILIIISSSIIANRISRPISTLTVAARRVAAGDLNIEIPNSEKGEIKNLIDGFNQMTKELRENQSELAELERENAWKEMARQVAHEIKNPLTPMKLAVQQLVISFKEKRNDFNTVFEKLTGTILNQVENLSNIASEFSRFGRMPLFKLEKVEILSVIYDSAALFSNENLKIEVIADKKEVFIDADRNQFRRLLINMFRNSLQAFSKRIIVTIKSSQNNTEIIISDDGTGIPSQFKERIFDPNFTLKEKGNGIGLKLTKRFIEGIGGKIELTDTSSKGTSFKISIPSLNKIDKI